MEINFNCKVGEFIKQLPKKMSSRVLVTALLAIQEQTKPIADFLPLPLVIKLYSEKLSAVLETDCKEIFSEETMDLFNEEFKKEKMNETD